MPTLDLSAASLPDFLRNAEITFKKTADAFQPVMRNSGIVKEVTIAKNTGNTREFTAIDLELYASVKNEREQAALAKSQQGYSKIATLYRVAKTQVISYEWRTQGKYMEIKATLENMMPLGMRRMELDLQHRIGFANATTYTDQDGRTVDVTVGDTLALASTAHTVRGSSVTYRNRLLNNAAFSRSALEAMEKMRVENMINQLGQKMPVTDDVIWSTEDPNTVYTIRELMRATSTVTASQNAGVPNVVNKYRHVVLNLVATDKDGNVDATKAKYWGLCSTRDSAFYLGVHEEVNVIPPTVGDGQNALTDDWFFGVRAGYMIVIPDPAWFSLSLGDGTA